MTSSLPLHRLTQDLEELNVRILAAVDVRFNEFREQVISIKNRIEARLIGLQLGAFAPPIVMAYEEAVSRLFDEFSAQVTKSIEDSIKSKIIEMSQVLSQTNNMVEDELKKKSKEIDHEAQTKIEQFRTEAQERIAQAEEEVERARTIAASELEKGKEEYETEKRILLAKIEELNNQLDGLSQKSNDEYKQALMDLSKAREHEEEREAQYKVELENLERQWQGQIELLQETKDDIENVLKVKDAEIEALQNQLDDKSRELAEYESAASQLKDSLSQQESSIQENNLEHEHILTEKDTYIQDLEKANNERESMLAQKDERIKELEYALKEKDLLMEKVASDHDATLQAKDAETRRNMALLTGVDGKQIDVREVLVKSEEDKEVASQAKYRIKVLETELDRLTKLTEDTPQFKLFWLIKQRSPKWVKTSELAETVGIPAIMVRRHLQKYAEVGLLEVQKGEARYIEPVITKT